ncbi:MAG: LysM peptidoglycan-binding domain-containing protein, partial [Actinomycetota bacterium]|nr:LysM peptidoglycan-binding domain-containing protein [Actinomycetota bacterium]
GGGEPPGEAEPPVMRRLPDTAAEPMPPEAEGAVAPAAPLHEWVVAPGDHLWSVAARVLEAAWETDASDDQVAPYWHQLVEANHHRLGDPANPDLVYPGQRLIVVEPPPPGSVP